MTMRPSARRVAITVSCFWWSASVSLSTTLRQIRPRRAADSSAGLPEATSRPPCRMAMRRHRSLTSATMCVDRITITCSLMSASRLWKRMRSSGSRPAVGSSTMMRRG
jgi:hypothetical protein